LFQHYCIVDCGFCSHWLMLLGCGCVAVAVAAIDCCCYGRGCGCRVVIDCGCCSRGLWLLRSCGHGFVAIAVAIIDYCLWLLIVGCCSCWILAVAVLVCWLLRSLTVGCRWLLLLQSWICGYLGHWYLLLQSWICGCSGCGFQGHWLIHLRSLVWLSCSWVWLLQLWLSVTTSHFMQTPSMIQFCRMLNIVDRYRQFGSTELWCLFSLETGNLKLIFWAAYSWLMKNLLLQVQLLVRRLLKDNWLTMANSRCKIILLVGYQSYEEREDNKKIWSIDQTRLSVSSFT